MQATQEGAGTVGLHHFFWPESIAVIGASGSPGALAARPLRLLQQCKYDGRLYPVNPRYDELRGLPCYPTVAELPEVPDLALVLVRALDVPKIVDACGSKGIKNVVVIGSGFAEQATGGSSLHDELATVLKKYPDLRLAGPNSEGFFNVLGRVPVTFSPTVDLKRGVGSPLSGPVAVVAQSGGLGFALFADGQSRGLGFGYVVSTGNEDDLSALDYVDHFIDDPSVGVITLFIEGLQDGAQLERVAERANDAGKYLIVSKAGASAAGQRATKSHTAHLAGNDAQYRALFRRYGIAVATDQEELVDMAMAFAWAPQPRGNRVAILTYSGGAGVWTADALEGSGFEIPALSVELQQEIRTLIPPYGSAINPVDVTAQVIQTAGGLVPVLSLLVQSGEVDAVVVATTLASSGLLLREEESLRDLVGSTDVPVLIYSYAHPSKESIGILSRLRIPWYTSGRRVAKALAALRERHLFVQRHRDLPVPAVGSMPNFPRISHLGHWPEWQAKAVLDAAGLPVPAGMYVRQVEDLTAAALEVGLPVVLKAQSSGLLHKSDVGAVALDLRDISAVGAAARRINEDLAREAPCAEIDGWLVEQMCVPGFEMIVGTLRDPSLGTALVLGFGGIYAELLSDTVCVPYPATATELHQELERLRGFALLEGVRGRPPADIDAFVDVAVAIGDMVLTHPEIAEIELNPIVVWNVGQGAMILDVSGRIE